MADVKYSATYLIIFGTYKHLFT